MIFLNFGKIRWPPPSGNLVEASIFLWNHIWVNPALLILFSIRSQLAAIHSNQLNKTNFSRLEWDVGRSALLYNIILQIRTKSAGCLPVCYCGSRWWRRGGRPPPRRRLWRSIRTPGPPPAPATRQQMWAWTRPPARCAAWPAALPRCPPRRSKFRGPPS